MKPHRTKPWLNACPKDPERFAEEVCTVCRTYQYAPILHRVGVHVVCIDEMSGIQALERLHPTLTMKPGLIERREFEYVRHGTQCLIANFEVATGRILAPTVGDTRSEQDFAEHLERLITRDPDAEWVFVTDQLDVHRSESVVRLVAKHVGIDESELGAKYKEGTLKSKISRSAFLTDRTHRIRFVYTPTHCSWLNQIEIWFSILVRRLIRRGNFTSKQDLKEQVLDFIRYFNRILAKPFKWTYAGKVLRR